MPGLRPRMPEPDPSTQFACAKCGQTYSYVSMGTHKHTAQEWIDYQQATGKPAGYPLWTPVGVTPAPMPRPPYEPIT